MLSRKVVHGCIRYLTNRLEQDHRSMTQRDYPMGGFGSFEAVVRFCTAQDELRNYSQPRRTLGRLSAGPYNGRYFAIVGPL